MLPLKLKAGNYYLSTNQRLHLPSSLECRKPTVTNCNMNTEKQAFQMQSVRTVFLFHLLQGCFFFIRYTRPASNRHQQCIAKLERLGRVKWRQKTLSVLIWRRVRQSAGSCSDRLISAEKAFFIGLFSHSASQMGPTRDKTI